MASEFPHMDKYVDAFSKHFEEIDRLQDRILKGHLIIESILDEIISNIFFQPEYVHEMELEFKQKIQLVRAYATRGIHKSSYWMSIGFQI